MTTHKTLVQSLLARIERLKETNRKLKIDNELLRAACDRLIAAKKS
jgi:hypothetical protein